MNVQHQEVNPNVKHRLWVIMMYQCKFIDCRKCTTLVWDFDSEGYGTGNIKEVSVPSVQFCSKPKTALKIKVY